MPDDDNSEPSIKADIGAKLEAKIDVPADVSRDTLVFVQRLLGPVAEVSDFLGDKVRFYRWKSAMKVITRAREIAGESGIEPNSVPLKFLVPFLERASLEELDSSLIDDWVNLLVTASKDYRSYLNTFSEILASLGSAEAKLLKTLVGEHFKQSPEVHRRATEIFAVAETLKWQIKPLFESRSDQIFGDTFEDVLQEIEEFEAPTPVKILQLQLRCGKDEHFAFLFIFTEVYRGNQISFDILNQLGLIRFRREHVELSNNWSGVVTFIEPTPLGLEFVARCEGFRRNTEQM